MHGLSVSAIRLALARSRPKQVLTSTQQISTRRPPGDLTYRKNKYTPLPPSENGPLYALLEAHCHSPRRLALEHYPLPSPSAPSFPSHEPAAAPAKPLAVVLDCERVRRAVGLERPCRELVGVRIRDGGKGAHDSLEDVLATREVVVWCLRHPEELKAWAAQNWRAKARGGKGRQGRRKGSSGEGRKKAAPVREPNVDEDISDDDDVDDDDDDSELLRWEDVVDWDTWPKSPPDWSD